MFDPTFAPKFAIFDAPLSKYLPSYDRRIPPELLISWSGLNCLPKPEPNTGFFFPSS